MDKLGASYGEDADITPTSSPSKRRRVLRTLLGPEPGDPTGMSIVATAATAVRVGEVDEDGDDRVDV